MQLVGFAAKAVEVAAKVALATALVIWVPEMDLLVRVSVVLRPTKVSVASGSVRVLAVVKVERRMPSIPVVPVTSRVKRLVTSVLSTTKLVESERDLFVKV